MTDILATVLRIALAIAPAIKDAIAAGSTEGIVTASLIAATRAAELAAKARVDARAGHATSPLLVEAVQLDDRVAALRLLGFAEHSHTLADIAAKLRAAAARSEDDTSRVPIPGSER